jgi:hypothetical protein
MASQKSESSFPPIEPGSYHAICYGVIDIGTRETVYGNDKKNSHQVVLQFEIPSERIQVERDGKKVDLPKGASKTYLLSLSEKSKLYEHLAQWRGIPFTKEQLAGFDLFSICGANCLLQILNGVSEKDKKTFAYISGIMKLMKGMSKLSPENKMVTYSIQENGMNIPENLPDWIKKKIDESFEIQAMKHAANNPDLAFAQQQYGIDTEPAADNDEIPF